MNSNNTKQLKPSKWLTGCKVNDIARQGDVALEVISELPSNLKEVNEPVALGETSGHGHLVTGNAKTYQDVDGNYFIESFEGTSKLEHLMLATNSWTNEHFPIELVPNTKYKVIQQRQYDYFEKMIVKNQD